MVINGSEGLIAAYPSEVTTTPLMECCHHHYHHHHRHHHHHHREHRPICALDRFVARRLFTGSVLRIARARVVIGGALQRRLAEFRNSGVDVKRTLGLL